MKASSSYWALPPAAIALLSSALAAVALGMSFLMTGTAQPPAPRALPALHATTAAWTPGPARVPHDDTPEAELDALRQSAALGSPVASLALVDALLNRSDDAGAAGDTQALFEATQWLQRDWDTPEFLQSGLIQRMALTHCPANPLFKWHWLCNAGNEMQAFAVGLTDTALVASIAWLYLLTNVLRVFTFVPQILLVWRSGDGARGVSLLTWGWWLVSHVFAVLYGLLVVHDPGFVLIAVINLVGCGIVVALTGRRRRQWRRAGVQPTLPDSQGSAA